MKYKKVRLFDSSLENKFFDKWETLSAEEKSIKINVRLKNYIELAKQIPFYKERLNAVNLSMENPLIDVPSLVSDDIKNALPPFSNDLLIAKEHDHCIYQSGGTTGFPKTAVFSNEEMNYLDFPNARGFYACGLRPEDKVANVFAGGSLYMTFIHINSMLQKYGCQNFGFSHQFDFELFAAVCEKFNVNTITGVSSTILNIFRELEKKKQRPTFRKILYAGEHLYEADKNQLKEKYGIEWVRSIGYGTVDTWYIGYQCENTPTGVFHAHDDQCYIEIINESARPCKPGETGLLYITPFPRQTTPIVRYQVGDKAFWLDQPCSCGRTTPLFHLLGRGDDIFRIGFDTVDYRQLHEIITQFNSKLSTFQIKRVRKDSKDQLQISIETDEKINFDEISHLILDSRPVMKKNISEGTVHPIYIEAVNPKSLTRNSRTGKLIRVIDIDEKEQS